MKKLWVLSLLVGVGSCAKSESYEAPMEAVAQEPSSDMVARAPRAPSPKPRASGRGGRSKKADKRIGAELADTPIAAEAPPIKRMVHYNGHLRLKVANPVHALQNATEIADRIGGYVESLTSTAVTLRVPVAAFRKVYAELAQLGEVLSRSLSAHDVTDAFVATELRVKTLQASRDRLIVLLGKARNSREKLRLLRQINRLTDQIDQLEMQLGTLASLAAFSRLTLEVVPHQVQVGRAEDEPIAAFQWIHYLGPFSRDIAQAGESLELGIPEGMVELSDEDPWIAESADGAVIWASKHDNEPAGTTQFWLEAVRTRLEAMYGKGKVETVGAFEVLRLVDQGSTAYRYLVGVRVVEDELWLVEVYYPTAEHETRYDEAVRAVIAGGEK